MTNCHFRTSIFAALSIAVAVQPACARAQSAPLELAMPAMPLGEALLKIARLSGRNLVVDDQLVAGRTAPPLAGRLSADEALLQILAGTGLSGRLIGDTIIVSRAAREDDRPARSSTGEEIVVTGSHVRGAASTSPVITLTRKQIDQSGSSSVEEFMRRLPQNLSAGVDQENFGVPGTGQDITQNGAGINLRGLGQRATLVLINGRRIAPSDTGAFVDVSLIPITAVERVEVLTDGASAIYGSDAVGGVVNFILRTDFDGIEPMLQIGSSTRGGGRQLLAGLSAGKTWGSGRALIAYEYRDQEPVKAKDRSFTINLPANWYLLPREQRHSFYGTLRQDLTSNLAVDLSGLFADRQTSRTFFTASQIPVSAEARARSLGGTAALQLKPGGSWLVEASGSYFRSRTRERETQGTALFNRSNTLNSFSEAAFKADGSLIDLPAGALKLAIGGAVRREHFESLFATSVNLPTAVDAARTVSSAYGELNLPLFSALNRRPGFEQLAFTAAGRFEHYERIGSTFNPKFGLRWSPLPGVALRSSYGTSFRAPLLSESFGYYNVFLFPVAILYQNPSAATPGVGAALVGNNPKVKPERSKSWSLGLDVAPTSIPRLRFSANYYRIEFSNRIALPSPSINLIGNPAFSPVVTLNPAATSVADLFAGANQLLDFSGPGFTNGHARPTDVVAVVDARVSNTAQTRTSGLDLMLNYDLPVGPNDNFHAELNANKIFRFDNKLTSTSPWIHALDTPYNPLSWRGRAGISWAHGSLSAVTFLNYAGAYHDRRTLVVRPVHSFTTLDVGLALDGTATHESALKGVRLALNVQNLMDTKPPRLVPEAGSSKSVGYDPVNANGLGRMVSLQLRGSW
jgi:outer membrane receptor protein involved in Fe transport